MELDDGKFLTGKPDQFVGKNHGFRLRFSRLNQSIELLTNEINWLLKQLLTNEITH